ncbi:tRNA 2-thiouridine(34) synthase MnmA [Ostreibacterium oceani]|uniref:tRNA-specific 2-thiouridylase MnmA n=1 Tax=Ostreibacterium oceani TaxID=2654998 RepID=A0A6N7EX64_9GAMM|nr:tRNA 2-thiouridine(34) synthase MnmA [Ostreibacterium oceani]MPV86175.1 tRNA 2-thiouridine(34) synthase MnmA [Ostreibacterium oceani]
MTNFLPDKNQRIVVGISGGVDSSVAAYLLKNAGYDVHGVFMKNWEETFSPGYCTAEDDVCDAKDVCESIGIPLHTVNFSKEYEARVFSHFLTEYRAGRTPNPDVLCNREIKFSELAHFAKQLGSRYVATGHYCRRVNIGHDAALFRAYDTNKDQTYFLNAITQQQLQMALFPLGDMDKPQVRKMAAAADLITSDKKDSTGICFIGERNFKAFLRHYLPAQPGLIVTPSGEIVGEHDGLMYYTIGQRQGLGIGGLANYDDTPWFVSDKNLENNQLVVVQGTENPALYKSCLIAGQLNWLRKPAVDGMTLTAKTRYRQDDQPCTIRYLTNDKLSVRFDTPQRALTLGQYVVFYDQAECLGGGVIEETLVDDK